jgi:CheY-like chemotaxis protein
LAAVLCIDDSDVTLRVRKLLLETLGHIVVTATSGEQGLSMFQLAHFDLVLCDYHLPGRSGEAIAALIKSVRPSTPFLLVSGSLEIPLTLPHVDAVFLKGDAPERFIEVIGRLLSRTCSISRADEDLPAAAAATA